MRVTGILEKILLFLGAMAVNLGLYLLVPYIQVLIQKNAHPPLSPKIVATELAMTPPSAEKLVKREIKEIKTPSLAPPQPNPTRPSAPGGGLKIDLSVAGGEGPALLSGGDRTGGIGGGTGGGQGNGMAAVTYQMGQTDQDAQPIGPDPGPRYPARADREGISGVVVVSLVVTELGRVEEVKIVKEEPEGYGFGTAAIEAARKMSFKPAVLNKIPVRETFTKRYTWGSQ